MTDAQVVALGLLLHEIAAAIRAETEAADVRAVADMAGCLWCSGSEGFNQYQDAVADAVKLLGLAREAVRKAAQNG